MKKGFSSYRRRLLSGVISLVMATIAGRLFAISHRSPKPDRNVLKKAILALFKHKESAIVIGNLYLSERPVETDPDKLLSGIISRVEKEKLGVAYHDREPFLALLKRVRKTDFAIGHTIKINGCLMSVTELRLCALVALA